MLMFLAHTLANVYQATRATGKANVKVHISKVYNNKYKILLNSQCQCIQGTGHKYRGVCQGQRGGGSSVFASFARGGSINFQAYKVRIYN